MVDVNLGRDVSCKGIADDVTLRDEVSHVEVDLEAETIPESTISSVEWRPSVQASHWAAKREEVKHGMIDAELAFSLDKMDLECGADGVLFASESTTCSSASNGGTRTAFPFSSEATAQSDAIYPAGDDEVVVEAISEVSALSDAANAAEAVKAVLGVWVRQISAKSDGYSLVADEEAVPEFQDGSGQIAGVGRDIHVLPSTAMEAPSYRRHTFAAPWSSLRDGLNVLSMIEPNAGCVIAGSGLIACGIWWHSSVIVGTPGM